MRRRPIRILAALFAVFCLTFTGCGNEQPTQDTAGVSADPESQTLGLSGWSLSTTTWSSPNGATVHLSATPNSYSEGLSAAFVVRLEGDEAANEVCQWDGTQFTAEAELNAADGYCYYVVLSAADGQTLEVDVNTPTNPTDEALINLGSSLNAFCDVTVSASDSQDGNLTITDGTARIQLPKISDAGQTIACQEAILVLSCDGADVAKASLTLPERTTDGLYEVDLAGVSFPVSGLEDDTQLVLRLDASLTNDQQLTAIGCTWHANGGQLLLAAG